MAKRPTVAELMREGRAQTGQSLRSAAASLGVDASYLSRIESGEKSPSPDLQRRASGHYDLDPDLILLAAGQVPPDIVRIFQDDPGLLARVRRNHARRG